LRYRVCIVRDVSSGFPKIAGVLWRSFGIAHEDARSAAAGFATLFLTIAAHGLLETARDTLFLARLPAAALPWSYLAIAALALLVAAWCRQLSAHVERRRLLAGTLLAGAAITLGFWHLCASPLPGTLFALYVWGGLLATAVTVQFWVLLGELLVAGRARRTFSFVAMGGLLGGTLGAALAVGLLAWLPARSLLLAAAALLALTAVLPGRFARAPARPAPLAAAPAREARRLLRRDGYVRWLLTLPLAAAVATTAIDFLFKSVVKASLAPEQLGIFFALFYTAANALALGVQLLATPRVLRALGAGASLAVLPSLSLAAALASALVGGLLPAALLKGADGSLRHSLQRTGSELLFVPLSRSAREPSRALAGGAGQRGGQALGSLLALCSISLGLETPEMATGVASLCALWALTAWRVGRLHRGRVRRRGSSAKCTPRTSAAD
jgi:AAA family ATP:ADP antiporter